MLVLELDTKLCMSKLLLTDTFDNHLFIEGDITTYNKFIIDGYLHKEFFEKEMETYPEDFRLHSYWKDLRDYCLQLIKGKRTPLSFRFIFSLARPAILTILEDEHLSFSPDDIQGLYLNFKYDGTDLNCTTGVSMKTFTLDKTIEQAWDRTANAYFIKLDLLK